MESSILEGPDGYRETVKGNDKQNSTAPELSSRKPSSKSLATEQGGGDNLDDQHAVATRTADIPLKLGKANKLASRNKRKIIEAIFDSDDTTLPNNMNDDERYVPGKNLATC